MISIKLYILIVLKYMILDIGWISRVSHSCCEYIELYIFFQIQTQV